MPSREDDALSWEGDDDPTLLPRGEGPADASAAKRSEDTEPDAPGTPPDPGSVSSPEGWHAVGKGSEAVPDAAASSHVDEAVVDAEEAERAPLGNVALVSLGLLGGIYLFWTIGWFVGTTRLSAWIESGTDAVGDFMFQGSMWLAIASPVVWFAIVLVGTRGAATWKRIALLVGGAVVLVPWPFLMSGSFIVTGVS